MVKLLGWTVIALGVVALIGFLSFLCAYPTMWLVNYIFASSLLVTVFGTPSIGVMKAWALNALIAGFSSVGYSSKKK